MTLERAIHFIKNPSHTESVAMLKDDDGSYSLVSGKVCIDYQKRNGANIVAINKSIFYRRKKNSFYGFRRRIFCSKEYEKYFNK